MALYVIPNNPAPIGNLQDKLFGLQEEIRKLENKEKQFHTIMQKFPDASYVERSDGLSGYVSRSINQNTPKVKKFYFRHAREPGRFSYSWSVTIKAWKAQTQILGLECINVPAQEVFDLANRSIA
jgi:hypothetical protein